MSARDRAGDLGRKKFVLVFVDGADVIQAAVPGRSKTYDVNVLAAIRYDIDSP